MLQSKHPVSIPFSNDKQIVMILLIHAVLFQEYKFFSKPEMLFYIILLIGIQNDLSFFGQKPAGFLEKLSIE